MLICIWKDHFRLSVFFLFLILTHNWIVFRFSEYILPSRLQPSCLVDLYGEIVAWDSVFAVFLLVHLIYCVKCESTLYSVAKIRLIRVNKRNKYHPEWKFSVYMKNDLFVIGFNAKVIQCVDFHRHTRVTDWNNYAILS